MEGLNGDDSKHCYFMICGTSVDDLNLIVNRSSSNIWHRGWTDADKLKKLLSHSRLVALSWTNSLKRMNLIIIVTIESDYGVPPFPYLLSH